MKRILILSTLILTSCGKSGSVPAEFKPYVDAFVSQGLRYSRHIDTQPLTIELADIKDTREGQCILGTHCVQINPKYWHSSDELERSILMKHELGHCLLGRGHKSDLLENGYPASIMNRSAIPSFVYTGNVELYESELYGQ